MSAPDVSPRKQTLIVGFGRSGRDLHLRCLRKMQNGNGNGQAPRQIGIIDVEHRPLSAA
jgi:hypothetical protein